MIQTKCDHFFCQECYDSMLAADIGDPTKSQSVCPNCRTVVAEYGPTQRHADSFSGRIEVLLDQMDFPTHRLHELGDHWSQSRLNELGDIWYIPRAHPDHQLRPMPLLHATSSSTSSSYSSTTTITESPSAGTWSHTSTYQTPLTANNTTTIENAEQNAEDLATRPGQWTDTSNEALQFRLSEDDI